MILFGFIHFLKKINKYLLLILLLIILVYIPIESKAQVSTDINKARSQGLAFLAQNKYIDAMVNFQTALFLGDSTITTLNMLKTCYAETHNLESYQKIESLISKIVSRSTRQKDWDYTITDPYASNNNFNKKDSIKLDNNINTYLVAKLLDSLQKVWTYAQKSIATPVYSANINNIEKLFSSQNLSIDNYFNLNDAYLKAKSSSLKSDLGFNIGMNFYENFPIQAPDVDNLIYRRRFSVGLDWNILNNGLVENILDRKMLQNERRISEIEYNRNLNASSYLTIYNRIIYFFNIKKLEILDKREKLMNLKFPIAIELYNLKQIPKITVVKMEQQKADLEGMKHLYNAYNSLYNDSTSKEENEIIELPYFDFDLTSLYENDEQFKNENNEIEKLLTHNIQFESNPLNKINLSLKFNYNLYDYTQANINRRDYYSLGLVASAPLSLPFDKTKKILTAQLAIQSDNNDQARVFMEEEDRKSFYAIKYKQKEYVNYIYKLNYYQELLRIQRVRNLYKDNNYKPLEALDEIDAYLSNKIEQIDVLQEMYLSLLSFYRKHPQVELKDYVNTITTEPITSMNTDTIIKSIYIWSTAYKQYSPSYIDEFLRLHNFSNAIVSLPLDNANRNLSINLINELQLQGKRVELMVGDVSLLEEQNLATRLNKQLTGINLKQISALHLDVEPHTMPDWYVNREVLSLKYIKMLQQASDFCNKNQISLSVSIPLSYNDSLLKAVYKYANYVYLMAYEHKDVNYIQRKTAVPMSYGKERTSVCIRVKDFETMGELNQFTRDLTKTMNLDNIVIHDLSDFILLEDRLKLK
ncbi:MAG: hypothetical protein WCP57_12965 [Bacteroidota bacterium]